MTRVAVDVGRMTSTGIVGGGKGFSGIWGLEKSRAKYPTTARVAITTRAVNRFQKISRLRCLALSLRRFASSS
jgi:hypothetical protein